MQSRISPILFAIFSATVFGQERITVQSPDGVKLSMQKTGSGPALLLVHGSASVALSWAAVFPALNQRFTVYAIDRRGRAGSGDAPEYSFDAEVDDLAAAIAKIGETTVVAHSYGALIAVRAAATGKLKNVNRLILNEPPLYLKPRAEHTQMIADMKKATDPNEVTASFLQGVMGFPAARIAALRPTPAWPGLVSISGTYLREAQAVEKVLVSAADLAKWKVPTTMLLGSQSPEYMGDATRFICGAMADCKIVVLEGQGHMAPQVAPALFVSKVLAAVDAH